MWSLSRSSLCIAREMMAHRDCDWVFDREESIMVASVGMSVMLLLVNLVSSIDKPRWQA